MKREVTINRLLKEISRLAVDLEDLRMETTSLDMVVVTSVTEQTELDSYMSELTDARARAVSTIRKMSDVHDKWLKYKMLVAKTNVENGVAELMLQEVAINKKIQTLDSCSRILDLGSRHYPEKCKPLEYYKSLLTETSPSAHVNVRFTDSHTETTLRTMRSDLENEKTAISDKIAHLNQTTVVEIED